jgi:hypothetical protein
MNVKSMEILGVSHTATFILIRGIAVAEQEYDSFNSRYRPRLRDSWVSKFEFNVVEEAVPSSGRGPLDALPPFVFRSQTKLTQR